MGPIADEVMLVFPRNFVIFRRADYSFERSGFQSSVWLRSHPMDMDTNSGEPVICYEEDYPGREHDLFITEILVDTPDRLEGVDLRFGPFTLRRTGEPRPSEP